MAQAVRRLAWESGEVEQAEKQARVWADGLVELHQRIGGRFGRVEPRRRALAYLRGLLRGFTLSGDPSRTAKKLDTPREPSE